MKPIIETGPDVVTVIEEPGAVTFATRKEWGELDKSHFEYLTNCHIIKTFQAQTGGLYFLLRNNNPLDYFSKNGNNYLLMKVFADDTGKQRVLCMSVSACEEVQIRRNQLVLWE